MLAVHHADVQKFRKRDYRSYGKQICRKIQECNPLATTTVVERPNQIWGKKLHDSPNHDADNKLKREREQRPI